MYHVNPVYTISFPSKPERIFFTKVHITKKSERCFLQGQINAKYYVYGGFF